jgi:DNA helicase-2/ATP-dependent DNA helicase PcrA
MKVSGIPYRMASGPRFYDRREIKVLLAYVRVLAHPDDDVSARRIVNIPRRGIGGTSVSRLASWARSNNASFSDAIDHAAESRLNGRALRGAEQLSELLAELRPLMHTMSPADFVELVADRTGYKGELVDEHTHEADRRIENLADLAAQAGHFDDLAGFLEAAALAAESDGLDPAGRAGSTPKADRSDLDSSSPVERPTRRSRSQVLLGCLGLALFGLGATLATVPSLKEWTPPPQLSVATSPAGRSVAEVELGSAGPVAATLEVRTGGRTVWRSSLAQTTAAQRVDLPTGLLRKGSRVALVTGGHRLRAVDS